MDSRQDLLCSKGFPRRSSGWLQFLEPDASPAPPVEERHSAAAPGPGSEGRTCRYSIGVMRSFQKSPCVPGFAQFMAT